MNSKKCTCKESEVVTLSHIVLQILVIFLLVTLFMWLIVNLGLAGVIRALEKQSSFAIEGYHSHRHGIHE